MDMDWKSLTIKVIAFMTSILFLALGFFALWFMKTMLKMQQDAVLVSMLLVPILVYLIVSGHLKEISWGGLRATFIDVARKRLGVRNTEPIKIEKVEEIMAPGGGGMPELQDMLRNVDNSIRYVVLTVKLGKAEGYDSEALLTYLRALSQHRNFRFLIILNQDETVFAYMSDWRAIQILEMDSLAQGFVQALSEGRGQDLWRYGVVNTTVKTTDTNIEALEKMTNQEIEALVVLGKNRKLEGVIERDQVLSKLMLAMVRSIS